MMLDLHKIDEQDMRYICWWIAGSASVSKYDLTIARIALMNKKELKRIADSYLSSYHGSLGAKDSYTQGTYNKLFKE